MTRIEVSWVMVEQHIGDADNEAMSLGSLVTTSNEVTGQDVIVQSDATLFWTTEIRTPLGDNLKYLRSHKQASGCMLMLCKLGVKGK